MLLTIFCDVIKQSLCQRDSRGLRCILVSVERAGISQLRLRSPIFDKSIDSVPLAVGSRPKLSGFFARVI